MQPISRTWETSKGAACERKQLPLELAFAVSIHKGQGMTLGAGEDIEEAVLDLGKTELDLGMSYVGVSRFKALVACKTIFPTQPRFDKIGASKPSDAKYAALVARDAEAKRLLSLVAATKAAHAELWQQCVAWSAEYRAAPQREKRDAASPSRPSPSAGGARKLQLVGHQQDDDGDGAAMALDFGSALTRDSVEEALNAILTGDDCDDMCVTVDSLFEALGFVTINQSDSDRMFGILREMERECNMVVKDHYDDNQRDGIATIHAYGAHLQ